MEDKDLARLKERLEEIFEHEVTVKQAKQVAVFVKLFVSMGADFGDFRGLIVSRRHRLSYTFKGSSDNTNDGCGLYSKRFTNKRVYNKTISSRGYKRNDGYN